MTGRPGRPRDWIANLIADPQLTIHLKRGINADVPATATVIRQADTRRDLIHRARVESWNVDPEVARADLDFWAETSPLARLDPTG